MKKITCVLIFLVLTLVIEGCESGMNSSQLQTGGGNNDNVLYFTVFQDSRVNRRGTLELKGLSLPLDPKIVCEAAQKACGSPGCISVKKSAEVNEQSREMFKQHMGDFDWLVQLEPVCNDTLAFVNESAKTVVCFCAYE